VPDVVAVVVAFAVFVPVAVANPWIACPESWIACGMIYAASSSSGGSAGATGSKPCSARATLTCDGFTVAKTRVQPSATPTTE
jgi:hypothetical protein